MGRPRVVFCCQVGFWRALFAPAPRDTSLKLKALASSFIATWFRHTRQAALFGMLTLAAILCGCSASNVIGLYAADYRDTTANAGDAQLLLNILRARDNLPIHFYDLAIIHGSIQLTAGAGGSVPFALNNSATPGTIVPAFSAQSAPSFDVSTSDTQDFTRGLLSPIDPRAVKALFDQGVDPRIMLLMFFSSYTDPNGRVFLNNTGCDPANPGKRPELGCLLQVYAYWGEIDRLLANANAAAGVQPPLQVKLKANIYYELTPIGERLLGVWTMDRLDTLRQFDTTKYRLINNRLYSISLSEPRLAICYERSGTLHELLPSRNGNRVCTQSEVIVYDPPTRKNAGLTLRSAYDVIEFLGQVLRFQQEKGNNRCLTLSGKTEEERKCDTGAVLFQVNAPVGTPMIGTRYGDEWYALYDRHCNKIINDSCDYSLQVLAILELLLNENRQAKDIIATPRVQVVQ
jgi:hypothetical protein